MNESHLAWKERRCRKTEIWVKLKNNRSHKSVHKVSKLLVKEISETERFMELWQTEKSLWNLLCKSSRSQIFFKIGVLKNVAIFTAKHMCWSLFLMKLQAWRAATSSKRDSNTSVFLWAASFIEHLRWFLLIITQIKDQTRKRKKCWKNIKKKRFYSCINIYFCSWHRRLTRGGRGGEASPPLFWKLEKSTPIWRKNALFVVIFR